MPQALQLPMDLNESLPFVPYQLPTLPWNGLALCGEAPGAEEVRQQRPFCGRSGKLLDEVLADLKIERHALLILNVFGYQPPGNKVGHFFASKRSGIPLDESYGKYGSAYVQKQHAPELERLRAALKEHKPKAVVTLGRTPLWALTGYNGPMGVIRGQWQQCSLVESIPVMPSWHPSFIIRGNWSEKKILAEDIQTALNK
ncbi:MAG: uracil-DNA glycosylase [Bdellovibrionales bacterium]